MQAMLAICGKYAGDLHIVFNAQNESKCTHIWPRLKLPHGLPEFHFGGMSMEFVEKWLHLGHIISVTGNDKVNIVSKRSALCQQINNVLCFFGSRDVITKMSPMKDVIVSMALFLADLTNASITSL